MIIYILREVVIILTIKCAKCKDKILKYNKIGSGQVLRCWESKIKTIYGELKNEKLYCPNCNNLIGEVKTAKGKNYVAMRKKQFTYSGHKI